MTATVNNRHRLLPVSFAVVLALWSALTYTHWISELFLPTPSATAAALAKLFIEGHFHCDIAISVFRILAGFCLATLVAIPIGMLIGLNRTAEWAIEPFLDFIRYTPIPAFIPLFILWFGVGEFEKIVIVAFSVFFQIVLMVANSVGLVPRSVVEYARTMGASRWYVLINVIYPYSQPKILDDLRVAMGWAWAVLTIAEIVGGASGIGFVIIQAQRLIQTPQVIAAILVVGLLGLITDATFKWIRHACFPWAVKVEDNARA